MPESPLSPTSAHHKLASSLLSHLDDSAGERRANGDTCRGVSARNCQSLRHKQVFLAMMAPQQVQQLLSPSQLQALLNQQQQALLLQQQHLKEFYKKQQEQLHLHLLQQPQGKKPKELSPQQLMFQHLLQLQQQQLLRAQRSVLSSSSPLSPAGVSSTELQQVWKELIHSLTEERSAKMDHLDTAANLSASSNITHCKTSARQAPDHQPLNPCHTECVVKTSCTTTHVLYGHGVCNWPGCEAVCENICQFFKHLGSEHTLDDRSTAQCRVQMQVVHQLDLQLSKERERLQAMMAHLHLPPSEAQGLSAPMSLASGAIPSRTLPSPSPRDVTQTSPPALAPVSPPPKGFGGTSPSHPPCVGAVKRHHHPPLFSLSAENDLSLELYKSADIRPPFTYATLIRQAIIEASDMQLTLNEIYSWFTRTFAYFRRNAATWKNAVRHNLSLHKCFVRVENVKGAVWTVDELEYHRRRSQKITGSPTLMKNMSPGLAFGTALNADLQNVLAGVSTPQLNSGRKEQTNSNLGAQIQETSPCEPDTQSPSNSDPSAQLQQSLFVKEEALTFEEQESLMSMVKSTNHSADMYEDMTATEEEHLFDLA